MPRSRILLDITTLLRATGHADGITRTQWHLADYALAHLPDVDFVFLGQNLWLIERDWVARHLAGSHRIDVSYFPDAGSKPRLRESLPGSLKSAVLWLQRPRRQALLTAERAILNRSLLEPIARRLRPHILNARYRKMLGPTGDIPAHLVPHDFAMQPGAPLSKDDVLILTGSDWQGMCTALANATERPTVVALCHDTIPLLFPQFFDPGFVAKFRKCVSEVYAAADLVVFSTDQIRQDTERLVDQPLQRTAIVRLGADAAPPVAKDDASLPSGLVAGRFAMFVSTLEPRKGHRTLFEAWKKLLEEDIPQKNDFKLVFVGRKGWMVDALIAEMRAHPEFGKSFLWLDNVDDSTLDRLYQSCAFTLYPSLYEGFGLPIVESFRHGKAVIASHAGALRETVCGLSPTLDPSDVSEWRAVLRAWITSPDIYRKLECDIRTRFKTRSWSATADEFFAIIRDTFAPSLHVVRNKSDVSG